MKPYVFPYAIALSHLLLAGGALADPITGPSLSAPVAAPPAIRSTSAGMAGKLRSRDADVLGVSAAVTPPPVLSHVVLIAPGIYAVVPPSDLAAPVQPPALLEGTGKAPELSAQASVPPSIHEALSRKKDLILYDIHFDFDKATIIDKAVLSIQKIGQTMRVDPDLQIVILGFTDAKGNDDYNKRLSQQRAESVKEAIMTQFGIAGHRITAIGKGEQNPVASNDSEEGRTLNRRVEVQVQ